MKILHTADWHLGKKLDSFSRYAEQEQVLAEIVALADKKNVDLVLIAGDLFDTFNPPVEALELFYKTLKALSKNGERPVLAIAGNHDSPERIHSPDPLARACGIFLNGFPFENIGLISLEGGVKITKSAPGLIELMLPKYNYPIRILLTPYANEQRLKQVISLASDTENALSDWLSKHWSDLASQYCDEQGVNILLSHLFFADRKGPLPQESDDEKSVLSVGGAQVCYTDILPQGLQYVALGHLHTKQIIAQKPCPVVYSGSPLSYSFSETDQQKYVVLLDIEPKKPVHSEYLLLLAGKKLLRFTAYSVKEALNCLAENPDVFIELTICSNTYLTAQQRKEIHGAHAGLVSLIPQLTQSSDALAKGAKSIDLNQDITTLFSDFFAQKHAGQKPSEELLNLLKDVIAVDLNS